MSELFTLEEVDRDGAIQEAAESVSGDSRARFLGKGLLLGGGIAGGAALVGGVLAEDAKAQTAGDVAILNYALTLEYLEAEFYTEASRMGALRGDVAGFSRIVGAHERAHVAFLRSALGRAAVAKPRFNFRGTTENQARFVATAIVLEDAGAAAYKGQAANIDTPAILAAALSIHSVEARHASWIRDIAGRPPAPAAFDPPATMAQILAAVGRTGFIVGAGSTSAGGDPRFTG